MGTLKPKLRFPEFSDNWKNKYFKEIYSFRSTNSFSRDKLNYENGLVKNIHYGDIHSKFNSLFKIQNEQVPYINDDISIEKIPKENFLKVKDLIIADASEDYEDIGKCLEIIDLNQQEVLAGLHTFIARPDLHNIALGFGNYLMKSDYSKIQIKTIAQGTKVLSISTTRLSEIKVYIPSIEEQTKIANFLSEVDEKLNLLNEKKTLLEDYKKGIMQKIFNQEIRFKDDNGNDFEDWEIQKLKDITTLITKGTTPKKFVEKGINYIKIECLDGNNLNLEKCLFINEDIHNKELKRSVLEENDILFAIAGSIGKSLIIKKNHLPANTNQALSIIRLKENQVLNFIFQVLNSENIKKYIQENISVGAQPNLNLEQVGSYTFYCPKSKIEQTKIANFLSAIDEKIALVSNQIQDTQEYKKGLLQQMFV
jgi:type I restriction enzyme S subunit